MIVIPARALINFYKNIFEQRGRLLSYSPTLYAYSRAEMPIDDISRIVPTGKVLESIVAESVFCVYSIAF